MTLRIRLAATAAALALALAAPALAQPPADPLPDAPGKDAVVRVCTACHEAAQFAFARHTPEEWDMEITKMQSAGAEMTPEDQVAVSAYLARQFPKAAPAEAPVAAPQPGSPAPSPPTGR
jgi:cytochrome c553